MNKDKLHKYMSVATSWSSFSKDPSTQVGCIIIKPDGTPISCGYNGMVKGSDESLQTYERPMKYKFILHAEENAILHAKTDLTGCIAIITHAPCSHCLLMLNQAGIKEIYYGDLGPVGTERYPKEEREAIKLIIDSTNCSVVDLEGNNVKELL